MTNPQNYVAVPVPRVRAPAVDTTPTTGVNYCIESMSQSDHDMWCAMRQSLLLQVDAIERRLGISPRTAEIRRQICK